MEEKKKKKSQEELEELQRKQEQDLERAAILMKADEIKAEFNLQMQQNSD